MEEIEELCRKLKPIIGAKADKLWQAFLAGDKTGRPETESIIRLLSAKYLHESEAGNNKILLVPPSETLSKGKYPLGKVIYNGKEHGEFGLREDEMTQHIGVFGRSGAGKTNVAFLLIANLLHAEKPFLIFDWKRNFRDLLATEDIKDRILIFTPGKELSRFSFNPLIPPPGTPPAIYLKKLIENIGHAYYVGEGVMALLLRAIDAVYVDCKIYSKKPDRFPTFIDVKNWLDKYPARGRELNWMASTIRCIESLCFGEFGKVINVTRQIPMEELLKKNVVLELDALTKTDKSFLIESLLLYIHHFRLAEGKRETFKHAIILEEAHHVLAGSETRSETVMDKTLREIRELGECLIILDQMPSKLSSTALANCYTAITLNMKWKSDVNIAAGYTLLDTKEKEYFGLLPVGEAIIKLQGRYPRPFQVRFPLVGLKKGIIEDSAVKEHMSAYSRYTKSFQSLEKISPVIEVVPVTDKEELTESELKLLFDISKYPLSGIVSRYKRLGISRRKGNSAKDDLISKSFIETTGVSTKTGQVKLIELTAKGRKETGSRRNNESVTHAYWKQILENYFTNKGMKVFKEHQIGRDAIDLVVETPSGGLAVEIETGKSGTSYPLANIKKALVKGYTVLSVATSPAVEAKILSGLEKKLNSEKDKVRVICVRDYKWE